MEKSKRQLVRDVAAIIDTNNQPTHKLAQYIIDKIIEWLKSPRTHTNDEVTEMTARAVKLCEERGFQLLPFNITASLIELGFASHTALAHFQDPCIFCGQEMKNVEIGECPTVTQTNAASTGQEPA